MIQFLGRLHILLLHLPIGILVLAVLLEWLNYLGWKKIDRSLMTLIYGIGSGFALFTCISGYLLYLGEEYEFALIQYHLWMGLLTLVFSILVFYLSQVNAKQIFWGSNLLVIIVSITGHLGGTITHGENFLSFGENESLDTIDPLVIENIDDAYVFEDVVQYIFDSKCTSCHGPNKVKGKLRLDAPEYLHEGGKSGKNLLSPIDNEILHRIHLPETHKYHMPPDHKIQLTEEEIKVLESWMTVDKKFEVKIHELTDAEKIKGWVEKIMVQSLLHQEDQLAVIPAYLPDASGISALPNNILKEMESAGFVVLPAGKSSVFLEVNTVNIDTLTEKHWAILEGAKMNIVRLKLSGQSVSSDNLKIVGDMSHLVKLYLDDCRLNNQDMIYLKDLPELRYLNLSQNGELTLEGINYLNGLESLDKLIAYETKIQPDNLSPGFTIETGGYDIPVLASDTLRIKE